MVSTGGLVWISCRPLLKMLLCTTSGFILSRMDLFSALAARGASQVLLNVTFPCLLFSKMVPAFTPQNVSAIGPLIVIGCIYQTLGLVLALIIREFFWVPHRFRSGLVVAGIWSNWGDVPTAVILSITASAPFKSGDSDLGVAYMSIFILVFFVTLFPLGGHQMIARDFKGPDKEIREAKDALKKKQESRLYLVAKVLRVAFCRTRSAGRRPDVEELHEKQEPNESVPHHEQTEEEVISSPTVMEEDASGIVHRSQHAKHISFSGMSPIEHVSVIASDNVPPLSPRSVGHEAPDVMSLTPTVVIAATEKDFSKEKATEGRQPVATRTESVHSSTSFRITTHILRFLRSLISAPTIAIFIAFPIALVKPLKGLFVEVVDSPIPNAPDGKPPLYFVLDTANFLGGASIPLGLICLGAALAKLKMPNTRKSIPIGAIASMAIGKLVISPILGVLIVNGFVKIGFIDENDKVLRFVTMFFSGMPTATTQVLLTQVYSGTGEAEHLSPFLIPQYALMFISTTALTAYSLRTLF